jgi:hypothetical protein
MPDERPANAAPPERTNRHINPGTTGSSQPPAGPRSRSAGLGAWGWRGPHARARPRRRTPDSLPRSDHHPAPACPVEAAGHASRRATSASPSPRRPRWTGRVAVEPSGFPRDTRPHGLGARCRVAPEEGTVLRTAVHQGPSRARSNGARTRHGHRRPARRAQGRRARRFLAARCRSSAEVARPVDRVGRRRRAAARAGVNAGYAAGCSWASRSVDDVGAAASSVGCGPNLGRGSVYPGMGMAWQVRSSQRSCTSRGCDGVGWRGPDSLNGCIAEPIRG